LWSHFFDVWKLRCDTRHALDTDRVSCQHKHRVLARVRACYANLDRLPATTRAWFQHPLEALLHDNKIRQLEVWLAHAEPLVTQGLAEDAQAVATGHLDIRSYFLPLFVPDPPD
jgi:hypothetical protein